jgi:hypothetical protein
LLQLVRNKKAVSNVVFIGSVVVLAIVCVSVGFVGYYRINNLQNENNLLQNQNNSLQANVNSLQSSISNVQSSNSQLQTNYQNLQSVNNQLQSSYNQLNSSYAQLSDQYHVLLSRLPATNEISIDSVNWNRGVASVAGVTSVTVRNVSNETLHIVSLKLYDASQILQSSKDVLVVLSANSTTTINQYLPSNNEGLDAVFTLKVETLEGYYTTSDPLPLGR